MTLSPLFSHSRQSSGVVSTSVLSSPPPSASPVSLSVTPLPFPSSLGFDGSPGTISRRFLNITPVTREISLNDLIKFNIDVLNKPVMGGDIVEVSLRVNEQLQLQQPDTTQEKLREHFNESLRLLQEVETELSRDPAADCNDKLNRVWVLQSKMSDSITRYLDKSKKEHEDRQNNPTPLPLERTESAGLSVPVATIVHEMRNQVFLIQESIPMILESLHKNRSDQSELAPLDQLSLLAAPLETLRRFIDQINTGDSFVKEDLSPELFGIDALIEQMESDANILAKGRGKSIQISSVPANSLKCKEFKGDVNKIKQILTNFISNAIKYTPEGKKIEIFYEITQQDSTHLILKFSVKNEGAGISRENQEKLFKPYSQLESESERKKDSTGLGLSYCKQQVDLMGGEIGVESEMDQYTLFHFSVKLEKKGLSPQKIKTPLAAVPAVEPYVKMEDPNLRVLMADDQNQSRRLFQRRFPHAILCGNGNEALEQFQKDLSLGKPFQAVFSDQNMGNNSLTGSEAILRMQEAWEQAAKERDERSLPPLTSPKLLFVHRRRDRNTRCDAGP